MISLVKLLSVITLFLLQVYLSYSKDFGDAKVDLISSLRSLPRQRRAIGGVTAAQGTRPSLVHVKGRVRTSGWWWFSTWAEYHCSGTLIHPRWVMTAAHCFSHPKALDDSRYWHFTIGDLRVGNAWRRLTGTTYLHGQSIYIHPNYDQSNYWNNDIALVKLERSVTVSDKVKSIALPDSTADWPRTALNCYTSGWGCTVPGQGTTDVANTADLVIKTQAFCSAVYGSNAINNNKICASGTPQAMRGLCKGDSGGPLVCTGPNNQPYQVGISSFTSTSNPEYHPGVFTYLPSYKHWIDSVIYDN